MMTFWDASPQEGHERHRKEDGGNAHEPVHEPHYDGVHLTEVARKEAQHDRGRYADRGDREPHQKRDPGSVDGSGVDVASDIVGAEPVVPGRALEAVLDDGLVGVAGKQDGGQQRDHEHEEDDRGPQGHVQIPEGEPAHPVGEAVLLADERGQYLRRRSGRPVAPSVPDPRIEVGVGEVHHKVNEHVEQRYGEDRPLNYRVVPAEHRVYDEPAQTRNGED